MKKIIFLCIFLTGFGYADFTKNDGVITDSLTRLQWQDDYSDNAVQIKQSNWIDAIGYCENLTLGSYADWRLPSITELGSIVDYSRKNPAANGIFESINNGLFWTSTTLGSAIITHAWIIDFDKGGQSNMGKTNILGVRCVRAGQ